MANHRPVTTLFVPGLRGHVAEHWQTHMAAQITRSVTVEPIVENGLSREARVAQLDRTLQAIDGDVVIVAHSAGVLMTAFWDVAPTRRILGALLVTPADVETPLPEGYPTFGELAAGGWLPIPRTHLSFPATVVASRNDPLADFDRVASLAEAWGADLHDAGEVGHLNPAAGYGPWPEGLALLNGLIRQIG
jgi:predicted alpha/beta hydrolase family esterase